MFIEILLLMAALILALIVIGETINQPILGLFAAVLLIICSFWLLSNDIELITGLTTTTTQTITTDVFNITTVTFNQSSNYARVDVPATPYIKLEPLLGFSGLLLSIYALFRYAAFNLPDKPQKGYDR